MRSMLVAPSGAGKTVLLTSMILGIYKGCFQGFIFGVHRLKWVRHGNQLTIISETTSSQMVGRRDILIVMTPVNLNKL